MKELLTQLLKAKKAMPSIVKNKINPHFKSAYADLDNILSVVEPVLLSNDLLISQTITLDDSKTKNILQTTLYHVGTGQNLQSQYLLPDGLTPQLLGAAITYARRYSICSLLSITADEDDDGNSVSIGKDTKNKLTSFAKKQSANDFDF